MSEATSLTIAAPFAGWCVPLSEVPDPVFAQRMAGDGIAIDPVEAVVHAPCDGEIVPMKDARHAVTVRHASGLEILIHVGIDTVNLKGEGFELLVRPGDRVKTGDKLLRFDLDRVARRAPTLVSPVILASAGEVVRRFENRFVAAGEPIFEVRASTTAQATTSAVEELSRAFRVPFEHGLHVRPAAQLAAALRPFAAEVTIVAQGRAANARSTTAMMALGVRCGDSIDVRASGADAEQALAALAPLLSPASPAIAPTTPEPARFERGRIEAIVASRGIAMGPAVPWTTPEIAIDETGEGAALEDAKLRDALAVVATHLATLADAARGEQRALMIAHAQLLNDPDLARQAREGLARGKSAAFAWRQATRATAAMLEAADDPRMRERAADLRDLENHVLLALAGKSLATSHEIPAGSIVIAEELVPSQIAQLAQSRAAGFCTARGGATSHVAILASAAGIPALVAAGPRVLGIPAGTALHLDAEHGWLDVDPPETERASLEKAMAKRAAEREADFAAAHTPSETRDGVRIGIQANLGSVEDARRAVECGAEGCGLLRTEFLFLDRREAPSEDEQANEYQRIAEALTARPLTIRTLDVGGDKPIAYLPLPREENPQLGVRGLRIGLANPALLKAQLRAILRVRPVGQCRILLPMVTDAEDVQRTRRILEECAQELAVERLPLLGAMIETPSSALLASQLVESADFLSIGTNDLSQYTLAVDRGHPELGARLDALHPAVLRLIAMVASAAASRGKSASICGALGSDVDALPILIGLGIHEISAVPATIPRLKRTVRLLDASECVELAQRALEQSSAAAVRDLSAMARSRARASGAAHTEESA